MMDFGMISYVIPLETYPDTYNGHPLMYAALASQKRHMSLYLMNVYGDEDSQRWFADEFAAAGRSWTWARRVCASGSWMTCPWN